MTRTALLPVLVAAILLAAPAPAAAQKSKKTDVDYKADVVFALDQLEEKCGHFFDDKGIDWPAVRRQFLKDVKDVESTQDHFVLLVRLLARLEDGHAEVQPLGEAKDEVKWPEEGEYSGPGMFLCRVGKKIYVKNVYKTAEELRIQPGMEVVKIDGTAAAKWLDARVEHVRELRSFSTDHQADFYACHWGLSQPVGTRMKLELKDAKGKKVKRTITYASRVSIVPWGPAFYPEGTVFGKDVHHATLPEDEGGFGYVQVRRCKDDLPEQIDAALAAIGNVPGLILDFRGNSGGGFDHEAVLGRFIPAGKELNFARKVPSAGPAQYGGPIVVIVDATARSAGETGSGMFWEEGRAYSIGESPTAGMSAQKTTIELPSGLFSLYVAVGSNKGWFNEGRGLEGVGAIPHEIVEFDPEDLTAERDTLILRAAELLRDFPQKDVPYDPEDFGWERR